MYKADGTASILRRYCWELLCGEDKFFITVRARGKKLFSAAGCVEKSQTRAHPFFSAQRSPSTENAGGVRVFFF